MLRYNGNLLTVHALCGRAEVGAPVALSTLSVVLADSLTLAGSASHLWNLSGPSAL